MVESYTQNGTDAKNPGYVIITVRGRDFSVPSGTEQAVADEVAANLGGA